MTLLLAALLAAPQDLSCLLRRTDHPRFGEFRQRIRQAVGVRLFVAIGRALKAEWILDALLRVIRTDDPGSSAGIIFVTRGFARFRSSAHLSYPRRSGRGRSTRFVSILQDRRVICRGRDECAPVRN